MKPTKGDLENSREIAEKWVVRNGFRPFDMSQKAESDSLTEVIAQALAETRAEAVKECSAKNDLLETQIACATDLANTWAREFGVKECDNPYFGLFLRDLISRLWDKSAGYRIEIEKLKHSLSAEQSETGGEGK